MLAGLIIFISFAMVSISIMLYETKHSVEVDPKVSFIYGDYDEENDPTVRHQKVYCEHCLKNLDGNCNNGKKFGKIDDNMIELCKKEELFEEK